MHLSILISDMENNSKTAQEHLLAYSSLQPFSSLKQQRISKLRSPRRSGLPRRERGDATNSRIRGLLPLTSTKLPTGALHQACSQPINPERREGWMNWCTLSSTIELYSLRRDVQLVFLRSQPRIVPRHKAPGFLYTTPRWPTFYFLPESHAYYQDFPGESQKTCQITLKLVSGPNYYALNNPWEPGPTDFSVSHINRRK